VVVVTLLTFCLSVVHAQPELDRNSWLQPLKETTETVLQGRQLRIVSSEIAPYLSINGETYEGFVPDVLDRLSTDLGFKYELSLVKSNTNTTWEDAVIEHLEQYQASGGGFGSDLAASPLFINSDDTTRVQFLTPLLEGGTAAVYKHILLTDQQEEIYYLSLLTAGTNSVWVLSLALPLTVGLMLWLIHKLTSLVTDVEDDDKFTIAGSLWFALASVEWQGYLTAPKLHGARLVVITFFSFVTVLLAAYIGTLFNYFNAATQLQLNQILQVQDKSLSELLADNTKEWRYTAVRDSYTEKYIMSAPGSQFVKIREFWESRTNIDDLVNDSEEATIKVNSSGSAVFLTDAFTARYLVSQNPCHFLSATDTSGSVSISFGMSRGHPLAETFDIVLTELKDSGEIKKLQDKWFGNDGERCNSTQSGASFKPKQAAPSTIIPALVFIVGGFGLCLLLTIVDILLIRYRGEGLSGQKKRDSMTLGELNHD